MRGAAAIRRTLRTDGAATFRRSGRLPALARHGAVDHADACAGRPAARMASAASPAVRPSWMPSTSSKTSGARRRSTARRAYGVIPARWIAGRLPLGERDDYGDSPVSRPALGARFDVQRTRSSITIRASKGRINLPIPSAGHRFCLQLGITPVFVALSFFSYEFGLQNAIEHFNGLYTAKRVAAISLYELGRARTQTTQYSPHRRSCLAERTPPPWRDAIEPRLIFQPRVARAHCDSSVGHPRPDTHSSPGHDYLVDSHWCHRSSAPKSI